MPYEKTLWKDRQVEKPLTFTQVTNADGTITLTPAEGTVVEAGTPLNSSNLNKIEDGVSNHDTRITKAETDILKRLMFYQDVNGSAVMSRASIAIYGTDLANANFLVAIQDTAHSHNYIIGVAHFQLNSFFKFTEIARNVLTYVTNTLGTITISGQSGQTKFTIIGLSG
jgi:hypothetical protein